MEGGEIVAYNINFATALKVGKPDNNSKAFDFPSSAAERPISFRDSLNEAARSKDLAARKTNDNTVLRKELASRSETKLKSLKKPEVKSKEIAKSEIEDKEKQTEKIAKAIEEMLLKLEELAKLQQPGAVPTEKQTLLQEGIKEAIEQLTAAQSKSTGLETAELQTKITELKAMLEELKNNGAMMNKAVSSDFAQELETIIAEVAKLEAASKTSAELSNIKEDNGTDEAAISYTTLSSEDDRTRVAMRQEKTIAESSLSNEADEKQNKGMKLEVRATGTKSAMEEGTEEVKTAIDGKVEKVTVEGKDSKKQDAETESSNGAEHQIPKAVDSVLIKQGNAEMAAIKLDQERVDNQVEVMKNQTAAPKSETVNKAEIINQIVKKAELIFTDAKQEMRMQLEPENLGKLTLKLAVEKGLITAKFVAESYEVKKVIESNLNELKDMLQEKGLEVQNFTVSVGQDNREQNSGNAFHQWKETVKLNSRSMNKGSYDGYPTDEVAPVRTANPYSIHNGKFDHRA
jgi:flagellar hook-length control protein FliK